jgi:hypothetical protein
MDYLEYEVKDAPRDYDGPEDRRCGQGSSIEDCKAQIDELLGEMPPPEQEHSDVPNGRRIAEMMLYANGNIAAFDECDQQILEMQLHSAIELFAEYAAGSGFDVAGCKFRTQLPGGEGATGTIVETFDGFGQEWD